MARVNLLAPHVEGQSVQGDAAGGGTPPRVTPLSLCCAPNHRTSFHHLQPPHSPPILSSPPTPPPSVILCPPTLPYSPPFPPSPPQIPSRPPAPLTAGSAADTAPPTPVRPPPSRGGCGRTLREGWGGTRRCGVSPGAPVPLPRAVGGGLVPHSPDTTMASLGPQVKNMAVGARGRRPVRVWEGARVGPQTHSGDLPSSARCGLARRTSGSSEPHFRFPFAALPAAPSHTSTPSRPLLNFRLTRKCTAPPPRDEGRDPKSGPQSLQKCSVGLKVPSGAPGAGKDPQLPFVPPK